MMKVACSAVSNISYSHLSGFANVITMMIKNRAKNSCLGCLFSFYVLCHLYVINAVSHTQTQSNDKILAAER